MRKGRNLRLCLQAVALALWLAAPMAHAIDAAGADIDRSEPQEDKIAFKFTAGYYDASDGNNALDLNLRGNVGSHVAWIGLYRDRDGLRQARLGYEYHLDYEKVRTVLSGQWASGGFLGGSITSEVGGASYAIVGFGRTNVRDYFNLNFDPNDAITVGAGTRAFKDYEWSLFQVRDDRLHTGQRTTHVLMRHTWERKQRLTVDVFHKRGLNSDDVFVTGYSWSVTYDRANYFVRLAHDPYAGFGPASQTRLSGGFRF